MTIDADQNDSTCAASILKMIYIINVDFQDPSCEYQTQLHGTDTENLTDSIKWAALWTLIELDLSIICGCGPSFPHLLQHWFRDTRWITSSTRSKSPMYSKGDSATSGTLHSDHASNKPARKRNSDDDDVEEEKYVVRVRTDINISQAERQDCDEHASRNVFDPRFH